MKNFIEPESDADDDGEENAEDEPPMDEPIEVDESDYDDDATAIIVKQLSVRDIASRELGELSVHDAKNNPIFFDDTWKY